MPDKPKPKPKDRPDDNRPPPQPPDTRPPRRMSPAEAGRQRAKEAPPLADWQIEEAARIIAASIRERAREAA